MFLMNAYVCCVSDGAYVCCVSDGGDAGDSSEDGE